MTPDVVVLAACAASLPHVARSQGLDPAAMTDRHAALAALAYSVPGPLTAEDVAWIKAGTQARMQADVVCAGHLRPGPDDEPDRAAPPCVGAA